MPILKILPDAVDTTQSYVFGNVSASSITANGTNLGTAVAEAFVLANNANKSTTSNTAPLNPNVGDTWFDTVTNVLLRYTNDGVSNNWIDISGPQNIGYIYQSYSITPNTSTINETTSNTVILSISTVNIADNTTLYWTISGSTPADFSDNSNTGSVTIINNSASITKSLSADVTLEGSESFVVQLRTGSTSGPIVAVATAITVSDTSVPPEYKLYYMGVNSYGQSGNNNQSALSSPTQIGTSVDWAEIFCSGYSSHFIKSNGTLWAAGDGYYGQLGTNNTTTQLSPVQIGSLTNWSKIGGGENFVVAIRTDGTMWSWGENYVGQLGQGNTVARSSPTQVGENNQWRTVSFGTRNKHVHATDVNNYLYGWGYNQYGGVGSNDISNKSSPVLVSAVGLWNTNSVIAEGDLRTVAIGVGGGGTQRSLYTWGYNGMGQLGLGNLVSRSAPVQIGSDMTWLTVSAGYNSTLATKTDGTLWAWGGNESGQLGINSQQAWPNFRSSPVQVAGTTWSKVSVAQFHTAATKTDGTLWTWGLNNSGQLGSNNTITRSSPVQVGSATNWNKVFAGPADTFLTTSS